MAAKFVMFDDEDHSKLPTLYWLPKLHKWPYKSCFIFNSSACTTTELSILLTSCVTAIKKHVNQLKLVNETITCKAYQDYIKSDIKLRYECTIPQTFNKITHLAIAL